MTSNFWWQDAGGGYQIGNSLRFRGASYLRRDPASSGNLKTNTISIWLKQSAKDAPQSVFGQGRCGARWSTSGRLGEITHNAGVGGTNNFLNSTGRYRDPSAWYHLVIAHDTTQATESDRVKLYINGAQVVFSSAAYPAQNADMNFNNTEVLTIGRSNVSDNEVWLGYMAEWHFVDGQALVPTAFGEFNADGVWVPKKVSGLTYGTNGFYLDYSDPADIGADRSGNGNNWTPTNFELTNTTSHLYDWMADSPTTNWCTLNPLYTPTSMNFADGNLSFQPTASNWYVARSNLGVSSGKWYCEMKLSSMNECRIALTARVDNDVRGTNTACYSNKGAVEKSGSLVVSASSWGVGDLMGMAFDASSGSCAFYKNGTLQ